MTTKPQEVSLLLRAWSDGDQTALDKLMPLVYEELRRMAKRHMDRQGPGHTLQTTALIHVESLLADAGCKGSAFNRTSKSSRPPTESAKGEMKSWKRR